MVEWWSDGDKILIPHFIAHLTVALKRIHIIARLNQLRAGVHVRGFPAIDTASSWA